MIASSRLVVLFFFLAFGATEARSQVVNDLQRSRYSPASYFNYSEPADVTMMVNVWGTVANPGLYEIPQQTHLSRLLSLSGGPIVSPRTDRSDRTIEVRLFRVDGGGRSIIFKAEMRNEIIASTEDPLLRDGDVITVETIVHQRFSWRDAFPIIAAIGTVAIALERIAQ